MQGVSGIVMAYGQTGTGKTHTIEGQNNNGIIYQALE